MTVSDSFIYLFFKVESPVHNGGTRHASLSEEEENLAVLRR